MEMMACKFALTVLNKKGFSGGLVQEIVSWGDSENVKYDINKKPPQKLAYMCMIWLKREFTYTVGFRRSTALL